MASHVLRALARRPVAGSAALAGTSLAAGAVANPDHDGVHFVNRFTEASRAFLPMYFVDYLGHVRRCVGKRDDEEHMWKSRQIMWSGVATRLRELCKKNGGIYVKAGQHICVQPVSPQPFQTILRTLMDSAGVRPFEEDRATFLEDLGVDIEDAFAHIDPTPVASASLAQGYTARQPTEARPSRSRSSRGPSRGSSPSTSPRSTRTTACSPRSSPACASSGWPTRRGGTWRRSSIFAKRRKTPIERGP